MTAYKKLSRLESYYLTTNIKGLLIIFLVMYHFISGRINSSATALQDGLGDAAVIACFPIAAFFLCATPIFVFITGYGSKDTEACRNTAFTLYFVPYMILMAITALEFAILNGLPIRYFPFDPLMQLWFLLSMFIWMLTLKDIARIRFILPVSVLVMIIIGMLSNNGVFAYSSGLTKFFGLSRAFYFFPFLLLGYFTGQKSLERVRNVKTAIALIAAALFAAISVGIAAFCICDPNFGIHNLLIFKGDDTYLNYLVTNGGPAFFNAHWKVNVAGAAITLMLSAVTLLLLFVLLRFMPKKKVPLLTRIGNASYTVFCLHVFIVLPLSVYVMSKLDFRITLVLSAAAALLICLLLSVNKVNKTFLSLIFRIGEGMKRKKKVGDGAK